MDSESWAAQGKPSSVEVVTDVILTQTPREVREWKNVFGSEIRFRRLNNYSFGSLGNCAILKKTSKTQ